MVLQSLLLGGLLLGIDVGWKPLPDGEGMELLIQLSPSAVEAMKLGEPWMTDIPASVGEVRAYRITVGNESLPRIAPPPKLPALSENQPSRLTPLRPIKPKPEEQLLPEQQAVFMTPGSGEGADLADGEETPSTGPVGQNEETHSRPWMLLVGTALALAGSLGGNAYLLWGLREAHRRYQELAARPFEAASTE